MADDLDRALEKLSARAEAASREQARRQAVAEHAQGEYDRALAALAAQGFDSVEAAEAEIARLNEEMLSEMERVNEGLLAAETAGG